MYLESIALSNQTVLISGETGSGKELFAEALHKLSGRSGDLTAVNIAGLDDSMFSDTLFGHKKGAYTGADQSRPGLVERAGGGTVFLDEIGDLPTTSQTKLLRLLESREYHPLGSDVTRRTNARFIVATNRDLQKAMEEGSFRKDLYFRLRTHTVHIPPLREHPGDIPLLAYHFAREAASEMGKREPEIPKEGIELLKTYTFPGNVRELRAIVYDLVSRMKEEDPGLSVEIISQHIGKSQRNYQVLNSPDLFEGREDLPSIEEAVNALVTEALKRSGGNQARASRILGISPQALNKRLKKQ
jgi:transcriptional regulator with GAF, ATPase, and Fis domain